MKYAENEMKNYGLQNCFPLDNIVRSDYHKTNGNRLPSKKIIEG